MAASPHSVVIALRIDHAGQSTIASCDEIIDIFVKRLTPEEHTNAHAFTTTEKPATEAGSR